jgi:hypothetical protein
LISNKYGSEGLKARFLEKEYYLRVEVNLRQPPKRKVEIVFSKQDANGIRTIGRMKCRPFREPERDITLLFQSIPHANPIFF